MEVKLIEIRRIPSSVLYPEMRRFIFRVSGSDEVSYEMPKHDVEIMGEERAFKIAFMEACQYLKPDSDYLRLIKKWA